MAETAPSDLRVAVRLARLARSTPPDDASRWGRRAGWNWHWLRGGRQPAVPETREPALIRETFEAAEENRAVAFAPAARGHCAGPRAAPAIGKRWRDCSAQIQALALGRASKRPYPRSRRIVRMELALDRRWPLPTSLLAHSRALDGDTALLSFSSATAFPGCGRWIGRSVPLRPCGAR
jgi:hypothetical protein